MFGRDGRIQTTVRLTGYAHVALTPLIATLFVPGLLFPLLAISLVWFFLSMRLVGEVQFDLPPGDAQMVGAAAAGAMLILLLIIPLF